LLFPIQIDPSHIVLGLGFYGRSFTLSDPGCKAAGCGFSGGGKAGECTNSVGTLSFVEIQRLIDAGAEVTLDKDAAVQIVTWDNDQWVSYDDADTFKMKLDYANGLCLGGSMVWVCMLYSAYVLWLA
jgi:chitinase